MLIKKQMLLDRGYPEAAIKPFREKARSGDLYARSFQTMTRTLPSVVTLTVHTSISTKRMKLLLESRSKFSEIVIIVDDTLFESNWVHKVIASNENSYIVHPTIGLAMKHVLQPRVSVYDENHRPEALKNRLHELHPLPINDALCKYHGAHVNDIVHTVSYDTHCGKMEEYFIVIEPLTA